MPAMDKPDVFKYLEKNNELIHVELWFWSQNMVLLWYASRDVQGSFFPWINSSYHKLEC